MLTLIKPHFRVQLNSEGSADRGQLLQLEHADRDFLCGHFVAYDAHRSHRGQAGPPWFVGVRGVTLWEGAVLLGKRSESVTGYPGCWELAPGGALGAERTTGTVVDFVTHLRDELNEEAGLLAQKVVPFALAWNPEQPVVDICCQIVPTGSAIAANDEYSELVWVELEYVEEWLQGRESVPTLAPILEEVER